MPRYPRIHFPGAVFHVIARGNNQKDIFHDQSDFLKYLLILQDTFKKMPFYVLAYALMSNHLHILIEVKDVELSKIMKLAQQRYTQYYNKKYQTCGHVFQGRFKALLVDKENYLMQLIYYIHNNPLNAGLEDEPGKYPWTGHYELIYNRRFILNSERLMAYIDDDLQKAKSKYFKLINQEESSDLSPDVYIKGEEIKGSDILIQINQPNKNMEMLLKVICELTKIEPELILGDSKRSNVAEARKVFIYCARQFADIPGNEIAKFLDKTQEYISRTYQKILIGSHPELEKFIELVVRIWSNGQT